MITLCPDDLANLGALLQRINATAHGQVIPRDFKPIVEEAARLQFFDLPAMPRQDDEPDLFRFWNALFSDPLEFVHGDLSYAAPPTANFQTVGAVAQRTRQLSSLNWSGASITPRDGGMFTDVFATWTVPEVQVPPAGDEHIQYKSSCWVGLDGQRSYPDSTLPQIGTEHGINKPTLPEGDHYSVWIQWWPIPELTIAGLPVTHGERVFCWLTAISYTRVRCIIKIANDIGRTQRFYLDAPRINYTPPLLECIQARISGATAQWIAEAPTNSQTEQIFPLPDYGTVTFEQCHAISARDPRTVTEDFLAEDPLNPPPPARLEDLIGPTLIHMYKVVRAPGRRVTISKGERPVNIIAGVEHIDRVKTTFVK